MNKNIFKHNAFTFVELLMVMLILGIIITLTMPLLQNIKNDDELYRSYMKKAIHDVTDATSLVFLREKYLIDFGSLNNLCSIYGCNAGSKYERCSAFGTCANATGLRSVYNLLAVPGTECTAAGGGGVEKCFTDATAMPDDETSLPGIKVGNKTVMQFEYAPNLGATPPTYGNIYIDVNGNKKPNKPCQDRYKFIIYSDRVVMDTAGDYANCSLELSPTP